MGVDGEQVTHPRARVMGTVLRAASSAEVKKQYADDIFGHLRLESAVSDMERRAKNVARRLTRGDDVSQEVADLNARREVVMQWVIDAMVAREKTLKRPRKRLQPLMAIGDPAFVA